MVRNEPIYTYDSLRRLRFQWQAPASPSALYTVRNENMARIMADRLLPRPYTLQSNPFRPYELLHALVILSLILFLVFFLVANFSRLVIHKVGKRMTKTGLAA